MSVVDFTAARSSLPLGPLAIELDTLVAPLGQDERRDVRDMLDFIVRRIAGRVDAVGQVRLRLAAVVEALIGVVDGLDGDADLEPSLGANEGDRMGITSWTGFFPAADEVEPDADAELTWCESAGAGVRVTPNGVADDEEDSDPAGDGEDNGIADFEGLAEQRPFMTGASTFTGYL